MKEDPREWIEGAVSPDQFSSLLEYQKKLQQWNRKFSLTSVDDEDIFQRLIAPSAWLGILYSEKDVGVVADFGSGAGVPGLPMAIVDSRNKYLLVDANEKKSAFLKVCMVDERINIHRNIAIRNERLAEGPWETKVGSVVSRGAGSLVEIARLWDGKVADAGRMDIYKGENWEREREELIREYPQYQAGRIEVPEWFENLQLIEIIREKS
ncbi:MAG: 16S rRNA (guanine(527)-N(7))-methyltransferase RsmG [Nitrospinota bacterium]|nr:16S rRNA (guanine(527)-N(7))-methyltransferase RsmG [Nitrospinota bacterium]